MSKVKEFLSEIKSAIIGDENIRTYFSNVETFKTFSDLIVDIALREGVTLTPAQLDEYFDIKGIGDLSDDITSDLLNRVKERGTLETNLITMLIKNIVAKKGQVELDERVKEVINNGIKRIPDNLHLIFVPATTIEVEGSSYIVNEILKSDLTDKQKKNVLLYFKKYYLGLVSSFKQKMVIEKCIQDNNQSINIK